VQLSLLACRNVNIAWSVAGMNDADYLLAFDRVVMPIAKEFSPDLVIGVYSN
jgi:histone deacetylase 6